MADTYKILFVGGTCKMAKPCIMCLSRYRTFVDGSSRRVDYQPKGWYEIQTKTQMDRTKDKPVRKDPASPRTIQKQPRELRHVFQRLDGASRPGYYQPQG